MALHTTLVRLVQNAQCVPQPRCDLLECQQPHRKGSSLDGKGVPVEALTDAQDRCRILLRQSETRRYGGGSIHKQGNRVITQYVSQGARRVRYTLLNGPCRGRWRYGEERNGPDDFAPNQERFSARRKHPNPRASLQYIVDQGGKVGRQTITVVEHKQELQVCKNRPDVIERAELRSCDLAHGGHESIDGRIDSAGACQAHLDNAVGEAVGGACHRLDGET